MKKILFALAAVSVLGLGACKKSYLETKPTDKVSVKGLFEYTSNIYPLLEGIHAGMNTQFYDHPNAWGSKYLDVVNDVMGNDMVLSNSGYEWFSFNYTYTGPRRTNYWAAVHPWTYCFKSVNTLNEIITNIDAAKGPDSEKNDIKGQAHAYRAYFYWNLAQLYCKSYQGGANGAALGLPLYEEPISKGGADGKARATLKETYEFIEADIKKAVEFLGSGAKTHTEKSHISLAVAKGLYARIALDLHKWDVAYTNASEAVAGKSLMEMSEVTGGMNKRTNPEFMWCSTLTEEQATKFIYSSFISFMYAEGPTSYAGVGAWKKITSSLYNQISSSDARKGWFNNELRQVKFRTQGQDNYYCDASYMRVAEMYLIMAEAANEGGNSGNATTAISDLLQKRTTASVNIPSDQASLREFIRTQRRIELWGEGFGFKDIKRWGTGLNRMTGPGNHDQSTCIETVLPAGDNKLVFKIPQSEIDNNKNMDESQQNP